MNKTIITNYGKLFIQGQDSSNQCVAIGMNGGFKK
jgi:hypothetical protein